MTDESTQDIIAGLMERLDSLNTNMVRVAKALEAVNYQGAIMIQQRR